MEKIGKNENKDLRVIVKEALTSIGLSEVISIEFPKKDRRALDFVANYRGNKVLVKVSRSITSRRRDFYELKRISEMLNLSSLVVTEYFNKDEVLDNVLYIRDRVGIISPKTLNDLKKGVKISIYERNGLFYVRINGQKLRELRERKGYSLHQLARIIGISTKALYEYEQGRIDMSVEVAERFVDVFGEEFEEVLEEIDIFSERIYRAVEHSGAHLSVKKSQSYKERIVVKALKQGMIAEAFDFMPSDIVLYTKETSFFVALLNEHYDHSSAIIKCKENAKLARALKGKALTIVDEPVIKELGLELEKYSELYSFSELDDILTEAARSARR